MLDRSAGIVRALDPVRVLERGYSITRDDTGTIVRRIDDVVVGARVQVQVADGGFRARVEDARSAAGEPSRAGANGDEGGDDR